MLSYTFIWRLIDGFGFVAPQTKAHVISGTSRVNCLLRELMDASKDAKPVAQF